MRPIAALARALQSLARSPGYSTSAIVSIALGLALSTATFAMVDAVLHPAPAFADVDQLFRVDLRFGNQKTPPTVGDQIRALRSLPQVQGVVASWAPGLGPVTSSRTARGSPRAASPNAWSVLGVAPLRGRVPTDGEARAQSVAVVSDNFWRQEYANRKSLDGASVTVGARSFTIVGVLPNKATEHYGGYVWIAGDEQRALDTLRLRGGYRGATIYVRLKAGETLESTRADLDRLATAFTRDHVGVLSGAPPYRLNLISMRPRLPDVTGLEVLFFGLAFGILAIGCTNVAALTLARGLARRRDYALRLALGASRRTIAAAVLAEVGVLVLVGGVIGFGITYGLLGVFTTLIPEEITWSWMEPPVMNARIFAWSGIAVLFATAAAGAIPAWRASRVAPSDPLKDGAGTTTGRSKGEFRILVIGELAIAMVLLMMASLMSLSARNVLAHDFGFDAHSLISVQVGLPSSGTGQMSAADRRAFGELALGIARSTPGVPAVSLRSYGGQIPGRTVSSDRTATGEPALVASAFRRVGAGVLGTLGARVIAGRDIVEGDLSGEGAAILSQRAAKVLFPRGDAIGRTIKLGPPDHPGPWLPVVGITNDLVESITAEPDALEPMLLVAQRDTNPSYFNIVARTSGDPRPVIAALHQRLRDVAPPRGYVSVDPFTANLENTHRVMQFFSRIFGGLAFAAILLSALGLFSVLTYVVNQRSREFAVRVALGASEGNIVRVVLRSAAEFALGGTAIGALLSFWASAGLSFLLYGVKNTDPFALIVTEVTLMAICFAAALAPALRASRANPLDIIRAV